DRWKLREPLFQIFVLGLAVRKRKPPAVIVDHDGDVIRIVERRRAALESGIVEVPFWRSEPPNELGKIATVFVIAIAAAVGGEIILVPPLQLGTRRQRHPARLLTADQITADRNHGLAALRPQRADDIGGARPPIETTENGLVDLERIHERDRVD